MCNIAGYLGNGQAAPILIEMLRRQQDYDGGMSTGIVTVHEGKLHWRKVIGSVETLLRETDALSLPGTVGIAHTRPAGAPGTEPYIHPFLSHNEETALCINGTIPQTQYTARWDEAIRMLEADGCSFYTEKDNPEGLSPKKSSGRYVSPSEARAHLAQYYLTRGVGHAEALSRAVAHMYSDNVTVMLNKNDPDTVYALRTTRPMEVLLTGDATYMATSRFAFPDALRGEKCVSLPVLHACAVTRDGITVTKHKVDVEDVCDITPYAYAEGYRRITALLSGKKDAPLYFDDLEFAVGRDMKDIWPAEHTYVQHAKLVYDILFQLDTEGRLKREVRPLHKKNGQSVNRVYMWLED